MNIIHKIKKKNFIYSKKQIRIILSENNNI